MANNYKHSLFILIFFFVGLFCSLLFVSFIFVFKKEIKKHEIGG